MIWLPKKRPQPGYFEGESENVGCPILRQTHWGFSWSQKRQIEKMWSSDHIFHGRFVFCLPLCRNCDVTPIKSRYSIRTCIHWNAQFELRVERATSNPHSISSYHIVPNLCALWVLTFKILLLVIFLVFLNLSTFKFVGWIAIFWFFPHRYWFNPVIFLHFLWHNPSRTIWRSKAWVESMEPPSTLGFILDHL